MNSKVELRHLRYFVAVAEELHFGSGLCISPSRHSPNKFASLKRFQAIPGSRALPAHDREFLGSD